jgi:hypothetical protein
MGHGRWRRLGAVSAAAAAALVLAAPSYAHFCFRAFTGEAATHAGGSSAWMSEAEWLTFLGQLEEAGEICSEGADLLEAQIVSKPEGTLFMGPGLLAGGTLKNGKGNGPENVGYLDFEPAFAACGVEGEAH